jgi:3-methyladenine DNA glycosylase AlkD
MRDIPAELEDRLRAIATSKRAEGEKRYLKSDLVFLGATLGQVREAVRDVVDIGRLGHDDLIRLVEELSWEPVFERRMAAVVLLMRRSAVLGLEDLPLIERLVREARTWALVDYLAVDVLGALVARDPDRLTPEMDRWATDADFWVRRASLLAELRPIRSGGGRSIASCAAPRRCSKSASSSSARRSAGSCARRARSARPRSRPGWRPARTEPAG